MLEDSEAIEELRGHVGEGCRIGGSMSVNRVAGNFHFSMHDADYHTLVRVFRDRESLNMSHHIHAVSFGDAYAGLVQPLDGVRQEIPLAAGPG